MKRYRISQAAALQLSLGHKDGHFLSSFQPYFLTLIWVKTHDCGSTSAFREAAKQWKASMSIHHNPGTRSNQALNRTEL